MDITESLKEEMGRLNLTQDDIYASKLEHIELLEVLGVISRPKLTRMKRVIINEDVLIMLHEDGYSNRTIAKELGFARRTIDRRINDLRRRGLIS